MRPTPYVASLRVYEPIDSFQVADQLRWSQIVITSPTSWDEQKRALTRTINNEPPALKLDGAHVLDCLLYTSPSPRDRTRSRMPSSA